MQNTGTETILFVDDDETILILVRLQLERFGYTVITCSSGVEALGLFKLHPEKFDLMISDMGMPEMDGYRLIHEIRKIRASIPILLCSGSDEEILGNDIEDDIADGFLSKPFTMHEISWAVRSLLDKPHS
ncbi:response regulator [Desulfocicer niacini]